jgi:DNA-directed RNA polymerase subunit RPC12/RpoP
MGNIVEIVCKDCKYRRVFNLGRTVVKESAYEILKCFSDDIFNTIKQMDDAYDMTDYDYGESIYICRKCNDINTKMVLKIMFKSSSEFIPKHYCNKCITKLELIENLDNIKACNCPNCGGMALDYKNICNWG